MIGDIIYSGVTVLVGLPIVLGIYPIPHILILWGVHRCDPEHEVAYHQAITANFHDALHHIPPWKRQVIAPIFEELAARGLPTFLVMVQQHIVVGCILGVVLSSLWAISHLIEDRGSIHTVQWKSPWRPLARYRWWYFLTFLGYSGALWVAWGVAFVGAVISPWHLRRDAYDLVWCVGLIIAIMVHMANNWAWAHEFTRITRWDPKRNKSSSPNCRP